MGLLRKLLDFGVFQLCYADCDNSFCSDFYIKKIHIELYNFECPKNQRMPQRINKNWEQQRLNYKRQFTKQRKGSLKGISK